MPFGFGRGRQGWSEDEADVFVAAGDLLLAAYLVIAFALIVA